MKLSEKIIIGFAAGLFLYKILNKENRIAGYAIQKELLIHNMNSSIGAVNIDFPTGKISAKERKQLLKETIDFADTNIQMIFRYTKPKNSLTLIQSSKDTFNFLKDVFIKDKLDSQEMFIVLYMNRANRIMAYDIISLGGVTGTVVDSRILIQKAVLLLASAVIISHNHPSGNLNPSQADISVTKKLKQSLQLIDISLLDHIIIADENNYHSFADEGEI